MIFVNGADNPTSIAFNDRALENVYFNGTLVWQKTGAPSDKTYGEFEIPTDYAADFGVDTGDATTPNPYETVIGGTAKVFRQGSQTDFFNDLAFQYYVLYRDNTQGGVQRGVGAKYTALASTQVAWDMYASVGRGIGFENIGLSLYGKNDDYSSETGFPTCAKFQQAKALSRVQLTLGADLVGDGVFDPSRLVRRVYNADMWFYKGTRTFIVWPSGDEYWIYTLTTGYVFQGNVDLYVKQNS